MSYDALNADQRAGTGPNGKPSLTIDQAAATLTRAGLSWSGSFGQPTTVTYAYRSTAPDAMPSDTSGFSRLSGQQIAAVEEALRQWSRVANVNFVRVGSGSGYTDTSYSNDATVLFGNYSSGESGSSAFAFLPGNRASASAAGDVWIDSSYSSNRYVTTYGGEGFLTLVHEIGHAIGLLHPSDYDADNGASLTYAANAGYFEDSLEYTVMSYFSIGDTGGASGGQVPTGPLIDDIAAAQRLYGANMATDAGNTVYGRYGDIDRSADYASYIPAATQSSNRSAANAIPTGTIWDGSGNDTIDGSAVSGVCKIDLRAGSFSNFGSSFIGALSIAQGATIENAVGGAYDDLLIGNSVANILAGNAGNDTLIGGRGDDLLFGGAGSDTAVIAAAFAAASLGVLDAGSILVTSLDGADQLFGVEAIRFDDRNLATGNLLPIDALYAAWGGRHAGSGELLYWDLQIAGGVSLGAIRSTILTDPLGRAHTDATVTSYYERYFGRDPLAAERDVWQGLILQGADFNTLRAALVSDPGGRPMLDQSINDVYQRMYARNATANELGVWEMQIRAGADSGTVRTAILNDSTWRSFFSSHTKDLYKMFFGREPTYDENQVWNNLFYSKGADFYTMGTALAADPSSRYAQTQITSYYSGFFGRNARPEEVTVWKGLLAHGATYETLRQTLLADPSGQAFERVQIPHEYQFYLGRDPAPDELAYWLNFNPPFGSPAELLRNALANDPVANARYPATITALYNEYFQRAPTDSEIAYWGAGSSDTFKEFANLTMKLIKGGVAATTQHAVGTAAADQFAFDGHHIAFDVVGFTPGQDRIVLDRALLGGANPLDHAQTLHWDFRPDTLIQLDPTHAVVLQNIDLAQLSASDFVFG